LIDKQNHHLFRGAIRSRPPRCLRPISRGRASAFRQQNAEVLMAKATGVDAQTGS
jgi:hypothetical protein